MHKTVLTPVVIIILYNSHVTTVYVLLLSFPLLYCGIIKYMLLTISAVIFLGAGFVQHESLFEPHVGSRSL